MCARFKAHCVVRAGLGNFCERALLTWMSMFDISNDNCSSSRAKSDRRRVCDLDYVRPSVLYEELAEGSLL